MRWDLLLSRWWLCRNIVQLPRINACWMLSLKHSWNGRRRWAQMHAMLSHHLQDRSDMVNGIRAAKRLRELARLHGSLDSKRFARTHCH